MVSHLDDCAVAISAPAINKAVDNAMRQLGCAPCCSGFDILFRRWMDAIAINEKAEVAAFGQ